MESELRDARAEGYAPIDESSNTQPAPDAQGFPPQGRPQAPRHSGSTWMTTPPRRSAPRNASLAVDERHARRTEHDEEEQNSATSDDLSDCEPSPRHDGGQASVHSRVDLENGRLDEQTLQVRQKSGDETKRLRTISLSLHPQDPASQHFTQHATLIYPAFRSSGHLNERKWTSCETYALCVNVLVVLEVQS